MNFSKGTFKLTEAEREEIAVAVKSGRTLQCISQKKFAEKLGFTSSIICLVENSKVELSKKEMKQVIEALGIKISVKILNKLEEETQMSIPAKNLMESSTESLLETNLMEPSVKSTLETNLMEPSVKEKQVDMRTSAPYSVEPESEPEPEPEPSLEETIQVEEILLQNLARNNKNGYTTSKVINALLNWFNKESPESQLMFMNKYETDITFYASIVTDLIKAGDYARAKEIIDILEGLKR